MSYKDLCDVQCNSALYLSLPVDSNDSTAGVMDGRDKDGLSTDAVHVDTGGSLNVIEMDVPELGDHVDYIILGTDLKNRTPSSAYINKG